jgi:hypothetical protein
MEKESPMTTEQIADLKDIVGGDGSVLVDAASVERLSKDFYWYSPVLKELLENKRADAIVQPRSMETLTKIFAYCFLNEIPLTPRGSGTGNYGQAIPLCGGIVVDLAGMDRILTIEANGVAVCEPGVRLGTLETEARKQGWELRCYPSTYVKASVGGFLGGGSGGIGSITHGGLRENGTVRAIEFLTMQSEPQLIRAEGEKVHEILHSWGTNGLITKIELVLAPKRDWAQAIAAFSTFNEAFNFAERIAKDISLPKRLVTVFEWPIPSYFTPLRKYGSEGRSLIFFLIDDAVLGELSAAIIAAGGEPVYTQHFEEPRKGPLLTDYTWNHTTLWAIKVDPTLTYLQCGFDPERCREQFDELRKKFGDEILFHIEFVKNESGMIIPAALPIVRYKNATRLSEMIDYCRQIGVSVANPHINEVEGGGRYRSDNVQLHAKYKYDPKGLMNPGKMVTFETASHLTPFSK